MQTRCLGHFVGLASICPPPPPTSLDDMLVASPASIWPPPPPTSPRDSLDGSPTLLPPSHHHQRVTTTRWAVSQLPSALPPPPTTRVHPLPCAGHLPPDDSHCRLGPLDMFFFSFSFVILFTKS